VTSLVERGVARRVDRLARRAHRFHRFAHHPLCDEYGCELVRLGRRTRVCRGCTLLIAGAVLGLVAGILARPSPSLVVAATAIGAAAAWASLRVRAPKALTRLLPGATCGFALCGGAWAACVVVAVGASLAIAYRRRGPDRGPCTVCPERLAKSPCRGMREIVRAERAFRRLSGRLLSPS
jgi:hypothetical protein